MPAWSSARRRSGAPAIAGVSGNGQVPLAELLCGTRAASAGRVQLLGRPLPQQPARLVPLGVARIPEDRHAVGVVGDLPGSGERRVASGCAARRLRAGAGCRRAAARAYADRDPARL